MSEYKTILEFDNGVQANMLEAALKERNIPFNIISNHDSVYDGIFQTQFGWGYLEAPVKYEVEIRDIFADLTNQEEE